MEAEQVTVEVVTAEVVVATVDTVVVLVTEPAAVKARSQKQERVVTPFEEETHPGGERTSFLPRTTKDYFKLHPVPQCWPWAMDTTSDSSPAGKVSSRRTDKALGRLAPGDRNQSYS